MSRPRYTFCEMNKQAIVVNHTSYSECENMVSPPFPQQVPYINPPWCDTKRACGVDPQTFVHRLEDSSSRAKCLLDDEEEKRILRELLLVYLALKYTLVHGIRRVRGRETGTIHRHCIEV